MVSGNSFACDTKQEPAHWEKVVAFSMAVLIPLMVTLVVWNMELFSINPHPTDWDCRLWMTARPHSLGDTAQLRSLGEPSCTFCYRYCSGASFTDRFTCGCQCFTRSHRRCQCHPFVIFIKGRTASSRHMLWGNQTPE